MDTHTSNAFWNSTALNFQAASEVRARSASEGLVLHSSPRLLSWSRSLLITLREQPIRRGRPTLRWIRCCSLSLLSCCRPRFPLLTEKGDLGGSRAKAREHQRDISNSNTPHFLVTRRALRVCGLWRVGGQGERGEEGSKGRARRRRKGLCRGRCRRYSVIHL